MTEEGYESEYEKYDAVAKWLKKKCLESSDGEIHCRPNGTTAKTFNVYGFRVVLHTAFFCEDLITISDPDRIISLYEDYRKPEYSFSSISHSPFGFGFSNEAYSREDYTKPSISTIVQNEINRVQVQDDNGIMYLPLKQSKQRHREEYVAQLNKALEFCKKLEELANSREVIEYMSSYKKPTGAELLCDYIERNPKRIDKDDLVLAAAMLLCRKNGVREAEEHILQASAKVAQAKDDQAK